MATAADIMKDGEFGAKPMKKDRQLESENHHVPRRTHVTEDKKTFQGLLDGIRKSRGVIAIMLMDRGGNIAKTNFKKLASSMYCGLAAQILDNILPLIESLDTRVKFRLLRSNAGVQELLIHPVVGGQLVFVAVQNCSDRPSNATSCRPEEKKGHRKHTHNVDSQHESQPPITPVAPSF